MKNFNKVVGLVSRVQNLSRRVKDLEGKIKERPSRIIQEFRDVIENCDIDVKMMMRSRHNVKSQMMMSDNSSSNEDSMLS